VEKTYLQIWFSSEGGQVSDINSRLMSMGFRPMKGNYDYIYDWRNTPTEDDILSLAEKLRHTLKTMNVLYKLETI